MVKHTFHITFISLFFLIGTAIEIKAQQRRPPLDFDQFRKDVAAANSPEEKLTRYVEMSLNAVRSRPDSLFEYAKDVRNIIGLKPAKREAFSHFILANGWRTFNRDSALYYGNKAAEELKQIDEHDQYLQSKNLLGMEYSRKREYLNAESAYLDAVDYSQSLDSVSYPIRYFYGNLGNLYSSVGAYDLAVDMYEKFMEYADNPGDRCNTKSRLASSLMKLNELEKAANMLEPCLEHANLPPPIQAITRSNLSEIESKKGQTDRSLSLMEEAASISSTHRIPNLDIIQLLKLGKMYLEHNYIQKADSIRATIEQTKFRGISRQLSIERALFFSDLAFAKENYQISIAQADSAIQIAGTTNLRHLLAKVYNTKAKAYEQLGDMEQVVENLRLQDQLDEWQQSNEKVRNEAMVKVRYQLRNKEEELAAVSSQIDMLNKRNILLFALMMISLITGGYIYKRYRRSRSNEKDITNRLQKQEVTIAELEQKIEEQNHKLKDQNIPEWVVFNSQLTLSLDEIRYIKSDGNYVKIFLSDAERAPLMERLTLRECEQMLPDEIMLRIHRSTIVNLRHAGHINNQILFLKDDTELKISRRYRKEIISFMN